MAQRDFEEETDWAPAAAGGFEVILDGGQAAMADMICALSARGFPPGAVIEMEVVVRRREAVTT